MFHSHIEVPQDYLRNYRPDLETYIAQGERTTAAVLPFYSCPKIFVNRKVILFIDNTTALSAFVNGYASKGDMARIVNALHVAQAVLGCHIWIEWVPSDANLADLPSRQEYDAYFRIAPNSKWVEPVLPPIGTVCAPLHAFAAMLASRRARVNS